MTAFNVVVVLFSIAMIANMIAFVRHWRMMRVMNIVLSNLIETQKQFSDIMDAKELTLPENFRQDGKYRDDHEMLP